MLDGKEFGRAVVDTVKGYVRTVLEPIERRLASLEAREVAEAKSGVGVAGATIDRGGNLAVTTSEGRIHQLGCVVGKDGDPGRDGADGFGFDDMAVDHDGERGFTLRFAQADRVKEFKFAVPVMIYRGVYAASTAYEKGDVVTWGGSMWHCNEPTSDKPETSKAWTLSVKRGQHGKDGKDGDPGDPGKEGRPGRDLTQMGFNGDKW